MKSGFISVAAVAGVMLTLTMNRCAMAADILQYTRYESDSCSGAPYLVSWMGLPNQCTNVGLSNSIKYTCSGTESFSSSDCAGPPEVTEFDLCTLDAPGTSSTRCVTVSDNQIGKVQMGTSCTESGEVSELQALTFFVLNICQPYNGMSYRYIHDGDGVIRLDLYTLQSSCFGPSETTLLEIGTCAMVTDFPGAQAGDFAVKVTAAVEGATLGESFEGPPGPSETPEPTSGPGDDSGDDDDDDKDKDGDDESGKSHAVTSSTSFFATGATVTAGLLATMF